MSRYNKKKVIYLVRSPLSARDFKRFGIKNWINHKWETKVFDITKFLNPGFWRHADGDKLSFNFEGLTIFQNINDVLSTINSLQNKVVFVDILGFSNAEMRIRAAARAHGVLVKIELGFIPKAKINKNIWELFSLIKNPIAFIKKSISFVKNKVQKIRAKRYTDYIVVGGKKSMLGINEKQTSIIKAHNLDYDFFIQEEQVKSNKNSNYLVFLDEDGPYHSDFIRSGLKPYVTEDCYYPVIDLGLNEMAKSLKLNIKIAAHPKSNYGAKQKKYNQLILENKTFELIRGADVVIAHGSTALGWAVIMKKPIIFVTTDEIQNASYAKSYAKYIDNFAAILGKKAVNLSQLSSVNNWSDHLNIDNEKYEKFIENYIKTKGSPEKLVWDIVIEHIESDLFV